MAGTAPNIVLRKGTYYVRVQVPADVQPILGKREFWESLKTSNFHDAKKAAAPVIARFKREIANARNSAYGGRGQAARNALASWAVTESQRLTPSDGEVVTDWAALRRVDALQKAWQDPDGWRAIEGFDRTLAAILTRNGFGVLEDDPILADIRQEAALTFLYAAQSAERGRITNAYLRGARAAATAELEMVVAVAPSKPLSGLPTPALTISNLFGRWIANLKPVEKEKGRLKHQVRRLIEFVGDKPANYLTKEEIADFMSWVPRLPVRRSAALNGLPMRKLVERFEAINADLVKAGAKLWRDNLDWF